MDHRTRRGIGDPTTICGSKRNQSDLGRQLPPVFYFQDPRKTRLAIQGPLRLSTGLLRSSAGLLRLSPGLLRLL